MDANDQLIFRYDNAPHYPTITTFPHHKHLPNRVIECIVPSLVDVLAEMEMERLGIP